MERYLHDLLQYALGVLHIVTLVPSSRKMIVNTTLSNNRVGIAVILDAANIATSHVDPEVKDYMLPVVVVSPNFFFGLAGRGGKIKSFNCGHDHYAYMLCLGLTTHVYIPDYSACIKCVSQSCLSSAFNQQ